MKPPRFLTPQELAERWNVPVDTLHAWRSRGRLDGLIVRLAPRCWRADLAKVEEFERAGGFARAPRSVGGGAG